MCCGRHGITRHIETIGRTAAMRKVHMRIRTVACNTLQWPVRGLTTATKCLTFLTYANPLHTYTAEAEARRELRFVLRLFLAKEHLY